MSRVLIVCAHWADDLDAIDKAADACAPLKAEGTKGVALEYGDDEGAHKLYDDMVAIHLAAQAKKEKPC